MELTTSEIGEIEYFLTTKGLVHIDIRLEILDHMCENITRAMATEGIDFEDAFQNEIANWKYDLSEHSSFWLGKVWIGPRIVINQAVKKMKRVYLRALFPMLILSAIFFIFRDFIEPDFIVSLQNSIGILYLLVFGMLLFFHFKIKSTRYKTTYSFLFRINAIGLGFVYLLYNPLWTEVMKIVPDGSLDNLFLHLYFLSFSFCFYEFYKGHIDSKKLTIK